MISRGIIPATGIFDITPELIELSWIIFQEVIPKRIGTKSTNPANKRLSAKIAYLNFSKLLTIRAKSDIVHVPKSTRVSNVVKSGFVYLITNKAFPGFIKIGMTTNPHSRLKQYQTYDPHRSFILEHYKLVSDRRLAEKDLLVKFKVDAHSGEWVKDSESLREYFIQGN